MDEQWVRIPILDLGCAGGATVLERRLARLPGVREVAVNPATEAAYIRYDARAMTPERLRGAIEQEGYRTAQPIAG